ncbi:MAG: GGDEF domain-containing protein [Lachnospiraceae bacterium]|nr:GGDEF domain-containing protein [Lachnospiraceae bacterium]
MGGLFGNFKGFLFKRVDESEESDTLALLLRGSSLLMMVYTAIMFIWCRVTDHDNITTAISVAAFLVFGFIFYQTYSGGVHRALFIYHYSLLFLAIAGTASFTWRSCYFFLAFIGMLSMYFDLRNAGFRKRMITITDLIVMLLVIQFTYQNDDPAHLKGFMITMNTLAEIGLMIILGHSFSYKFAKAESQLFALNRELKKMANSDPLTGLMNRRCMLDILEEIVAEYKTKGNLVSVAIGDIDFFKKVNDTYGHECGDYVLKELAVLFEHFMIDKGYISRWGGEEFLFVFKDKNADDAYICLQDLRDQIENKVFKYEDKEFSLTMTFGLEELSAASGVDNTIDNADKKLYMGKESGRNQVVY